MRYGKNDFLNCGVRRLTIHQDVSTARGARSYCWAEASAQPARNRAWFDNGPSRWTRSNCLPGPAQNCQIRNNMVPSTRFDLSRIAESSGITGGQLPRPCPVARSRPEVDRPAAGAMPRL